MSFTMPCTECGRDGIGCSEFKRILQKYGSTDCYRPIGTVFIWDEMEFYTGEMGEELAEYFRRVGR